MVPQSTMGSCGWPWKAAVAVRWVELVGDQRPKMLLSVKLGVVRTALDGQPPTVEGPAVPIADLSVARPDGSGLAVHSVLGG